MHTHALKDSTPVHTYMCTPGKSTSTEDSGDVHLLAAVARLWTGTDKIPDLREVTIYRSGWAI